MKKKIIALCLCVSLIAVAVIGGTLAYFTDTDNATNKFTVGNIKIDLIEENEDGTPFTQDQLLMPGVENAIVKNVSVKNIGAQDAYMWVEIWLPQALDADKSLHFDSYNTYLSGSLKQPMDAAEAAKIGATLDAETNCVSIGTQAINGVDYNGYRINIKNDTAKAPQASTASLLYRAYMDAGITQCTEHNDCYKLVNGDCYTGSWEIIVNAFGIQADGFATIEDAMTAYYAN